MNTRERMIRTFNHEETDRIPTFVQIMMPGFEQKAKKLWNTSFTPKRNLHFMNHDFNVIKKFGFDSSWGRINGLQLPLEQKKNLELENHRFLLQAQKINSSKGSKPLEISIDGSIWDNNYIEEFGEAWYVGNHINSEEMAENWYEMYYNVDWIIDSDIIQNTNQKLADFPRDEFVPVNCLPKIFEPLWEGLGLGLLARFLRKERKRSKFKRFIDLRTKIAVEQAKLLAETNLDVFCIAEESAFKNRTMIDPEIHHELILPAYEKIVHEISKAGKYIFFHSDGYTEPLFQNLIDAGFHGVESLEPASGMQLAPLKEKFGDKLCLIGNLDVSTFLPDKSTDFVVKTVKKAIHDAGQGGGYILSPTTDIYNTCKVEHIETMLAAVKKYGQYQK